MLDAVQVTRAVVGLRTTTVGVPGAPVGAGVTDAEADDALLPAGPLAVTTKVYDVAVFRPVKSHVRFDVAVQLDGGVLVGIENTE